MIAPQPGVYDAAGEYEWHYVAMSKANTVAQLIELGISGEYDVFLNLCDGGWDEDRAGMDVVEALERCGSQPGGGRGFKHADEREIDEGPRNRGP